MPLNGRKESRFFLVHSKKEVPKILTGIDAVIFGHSHKYLAQTIDGRLWLNPGSCGRRRFDQEITFAILTVDGASLSARRWIFSRSFLSCNIFLCAYRVNPIGTFF